MTWVRKDDGYTSRPVWDGMAYESRWHYAALIEQCSRDRRWDGRLPLLLALRCSDVPDPAGCLDDLAAVGLVTFTADGTVTLPLIDEHIPPPGQRGDALLPRKRQNQRAYRLRKCESGDHDRHCPQTCPARVTGRVTGNPGTGRDGTYHPPPPAITQRGNDDNDEGMTA